MKSNEFFRVKYSKIHGNGGFSKKDIKKGVRIVEYIGRKITKAEAKKVIEKGGVFVFELNKKWDIDGDVPENIARFINHSCDPNCTIEIKNNHIWIKSIRRIRKGEELSFNYSFDLKDYKKYPCRCGSKNCVGYILGEDYLKELKKRERKQKVLVAMSGGVDSSVAALLMKQKGYEVIGAFMKNWSDTKNDFGECSWKDDRKEAMKIASKLGVPLITLDFEKQYRKQVIDKMFKLYRKGITPNPDVDCNNKIKFPLLWKAAKKLGADFIVTGHYVRIKKAKKENRLLRAKDESKDQSYFLYRLNQKDLKHTIFPIGEYTKKQIREIAEKNGFENFNRKSTVGICFVGKVNLKDFLKKKIKPKKGKILDSDGNIIGEHDGIYYYTIGQRIGPRFGISVEKAVEKNGQIKRWYVAKKNLKRNEIIAAPEGHKILLRKEILIKSPHWINETPGKNSQHNVKTRIRQVGELLPSKLKYDRFKSKYKITLSKAITGISEGQAIVLYQGEKVLGGGVIGFE